MAISLDGMARVPTLMGSQACIRGMRAMIDRLLFEFPYLKREGIQQAVAAAHEADPPLGEG